MASTRRTAKSRAPITFAFVDSRAWLEWLGKHHASSRGVWVKLAKKHAGKGSLTYMEALDGALSWGWIDGQKKSLDASHWLQKFTPRGKRSIWSKINREKAEALISSGKMSPPGLSEVERAKGDGRWAAAYDSQKKSTVPDDLALALDKSARARSFFATLDSKNRYSILFRIHQAKKPETRAARIAKFVAMLERREKIHP